MRQSTTVRIAFVSAVAAAALARYNARDAYHEDWQQCVNQNNVVVDERYCHDAVHYPGGYYHWWYSSRAFSPGETVIGGHATPSSSTGRGGFGSSAHGGGGGE